MPGAGPQPPASEVRHGLTGVAALLAMLGPFSIDTYLPSFPDIEATFGVGRAAVSASLGLYLLAFGGATLLWGPVSDRFGRRWVILAGLSLYVAASIGCALSADFAGFLGLRALQGLGSSAGFIAGRAMIRDAHNARAAHRAMARLTLLFALAPAVAPVVGGWLHDRFGWRSVFVFLATFGGLLWVLALGLGETLHRRRRQSLRPRAVVQVLLRILGHRLFVLRVLALACGFGGLFLYISGAPTVVYDFLGLGADDFGWQFVPMVAGMMGGALLSDRLAGRWPVRRVVAAGLGLMGLASAAALLAAALDWRSLAGIVGPVVLYAFGLSLMMPVLTIMALDCFPHHRGSAASVQGFLQMGVNAAVAALLVPLLIASPLAFASGQAALLFLAVLLWRWQDLRGGSSA